MSIFEGIPPSLGLLFNLLIVMETMCFNITSLFLRKIYFAIWWSNRTILHVYDIVLGVHGMSNYPLPPPPPPVEKDLSN